jgi:hypothetical protein
MKEKIPYYIARYIDYCKEYKLTILGAFDPIGDFGEDLLTTYKGDVQKCLRWVKNNSNRFASAWVNGYYEIAPFKYIVKVNNVGNSTKVLKYKSDTKEWFFGADCLTENSFIRMEHARQELADAGFDWVFFCDGVSIEEVYDE